MKELITFVLKPLSFSAGTGNYVYNLFFFRSDRGGIGKFKL
mgnify:CR=1 FL=1